LVTGQQITYVAGDDGNWKTGVSIPAAQRFTDNQNGTVTDNLTGLIWLKNANCSATLGGVTTTGTGLTWKDAFTWTSALSNGSCGLTDNSVSGEWRVPNRTELMSLVDHSTNNPPLPAGHPFTSVGMNYLTSNTWSVNTGWSWGVIFDRGRIITLNKTGNYVVWPVRGGQ
jgi:hypothetical protein